MTGQLALADFPRLQPLLVDTQGEVDVRLAFGRGSDFRRFITGTLESSLKLVCERCGNPVSYDINVDLKLAPVLSDEEAAKLPKDDDPLLLANEEPISLIEMLEEEILLSLPMFAKHALGQCPATTFNED